MNSKDPNFNWHAHGVWFMHNPENVPILETAATTPYSCRAEACRLLNVPPSKMVETGFYVQGYAAIEPVVIRKQEHVTSNEQRYRYPITGKPEDQPSSGDCWLLTVGKTSALGVWSDYGGYIAWCPKPQRDKDIEREYGL